MNAVETDLTEDMFGNVVMENEKHIKALFGDMLTKMGEVYNSSPILF